MDFREATIDLGGKPATAPGAGGSGGGAIGPGARGRDGGPGGDHYEFAVTGAQVLGEVPIEVGHAGRGGVDGLPGEAGGHTRFGAIVTPGGGRKTHSPFPEALAETVMTSVSSAVLANYVEISNGLSYLSGAGWASYNVADLPGPFRGALCVWIDLSWADGTRDRNSPRSDRRVGHPYQDSDVQRDELHDHHSGRTHRVRPGVVYVFPGWHPSRGRSPRTQCLVQHRGSPWSIPQRRH
jgi:hypothetical protein